MLDKIVGFSVRRRGGSTRRTAPLSDERRDFARDVAKLLLQSASLLYL